MWLNILFHLHELKLMICLCARTYVHTLKCGDCQIDIAASDEGPKTLENR